MRYLAPTPPAILNDDENKRREAHEKLTEIRIVEENLILEAKIREETKQKEFVKERDLIIKELYDIKNYLFDLILMIVV